MDEVIAIHNGESILAEWSEIQPSMISISTGDDHTKKLNLGSVAHIITPIMGEILSEMSL